MVSTGIRIIRNTDATEASAFSYMSDTATTSAASSNTSTQEWCVYSTNFVCEYIEFAPAPVFFQPWKVTPPKEMYQRLQKRVLILWSKFFIRRIAKIMKHKSRQYYYRGIK